MASFRYYKRSYVHASFHVPLTLLLLVIPRAASLAFNYQHFRDTDTGKAFNISGDTYGVEGVFQLTRYGEDSYGRLIYSKQLPLWDKNSEKVTDFTTHFSFAINTPNKNENSDGITFFLAHPNFPPPVPRFGGGIGLVTRPDAEQTKELNFEKNFPFVAVEFDTFVNAEWDPSYHHVGVLVNQIGSSSTTRWFTSIGQVQRGIYDADISYNSSSNKLSVTFTGYKDNVTINQNLSMVIKLRDILPDWVEFGFSSATGVYYEDHTLISWSFNSSLELETDQGSDFPPGETHKGGSKTRFVILMSVGLGAGVLILILAISCIVRWMLRNGGLEDVSLFDHAMDNDFERISVPKKFSFEELAIATSNFARENKIGEGGFGAVYRGFIRGLNTYVAIKKVSRGSRQGVKEYASEVKIISQLRHKNLVQLFGWCHQHNDLLLIYEFMQNGSLDSYLFKGKGLLTWKVRYTIAKGLASALLYLHEEWEKCVLHRDIKSSNVMLDSDLNAKLGDFGLARLMDHEIGSETTVLAGTIGYLPPEAATRGKASKEADIYSFGVVALEIACGRKSIEPNMSEEGMYLVDYVCDLHGKGDLFKACDQSLYGHFDEKEMERLMIVGLWCTEIDYLLRPTIRQAVQVLNFEAPLPTLTPREPASTYNTSFTSMPMPSHNSAFANKQFVSSTLIGSLITGSSQSNKSLEVISQAEAAHYHTY